MGRFIADYLPITVELVRGEGAFLYDAKDRAYLDFLGGWCTATAGWKNKEIERAITAQAKENVYIPPIYSQPMQEALAKRLSAIAPGKLSRVFRCTSGSEAVEYAIQCARAASGKPTIVSIDGVYHGHTMGAAALGDACTKKIAPCLPGFLKLPMPKTPEEGITVTNQFETLLKTRTDIAAFMSEPIWTNAGCFIPPEGFYKRIQELCRRHGVLLVMDEVATCMGRTGKLFGSEHWNLEPDILCLGKSFTGGYATMAATMVTERVFKRSKGIPDYSTFGWLTQDCAATTANVEIVVRDHLEKNAAEVGAYLLDLLKPLEQLKKIRQVRGIGMVFGIEFKLPIAALMAYQCYRKNLLVAFANSRILFFSPPLSLTKELAEQGAHILKRVCGLKN